MIHSDASGVKTSDLSKALGGHILGGATLFVEDEHGCPVPATTAERVYWFDMAGERVEGVLLRAPRDREGD